MVNNSSPHKNQYLITTVTPFTFILFFDAIRGDGENAMGILSSNPPFKHSIQRACRTVDAAPLHPIDSRLLFVLLNFNLLFSVRFLTKLYNFVYYCCIYIFFLNYTLLLHDKWMFCGRPQRRRTSAYSATQ